MLVGWVSGVWAKMLKNYSLNTIAAVVVNLREDTMVDWAIYLECGKQAALKAPDRFSFDSCSLSSWQAFENTTNHTFITSKLFMGSSHYNTVPSLCLPVSRVHRLTECNTTKLKSTICAKLKQLFVLFVFDLLFGFFCSVIGLLHQSQFIQ